MNKMVHRYEQDGSQIRARWFTETRKMIHRQSDTNKVIPSHEQVKTFFLETLINTRPFFKANHYLRSL